MAQALTTTEVAALVGIDEGRVRKDVEHKLFGKMSPPRFTFAALVYFRALNLLGLTLGTHDRRQLYRNIRNALAHGEVPERLAIGPIAELKLGGIVAELKDELERFTAWKGRLVTSPEILAGETVFPNSRLSVRHVGAMLRRGAPVEEVREDYPYLTDEDIHFAQLFIEAYPRVGRPRERAEAAAG